MSQVLKSNILDVGKLEEEIFTAVSFFGCGEYRGPDDPCEAQRLFARRLANAISDGVARGVQEYLRASVTEIPGQITVGGPTSQVTTTPGRLSAP